MPTIVTKTIKPGGGGDYLSINAFEAANQQNLVGADRILVAECYSGGNLLTGPVLFNTGWTTDATRYIKFTVAPGHKHKGIYDETKAYCKQTNEQCIRATRHLEFFDLQFNCDTGSGPGTDPACIGGTNSPTFVVDRCILKGDATASVATGIWCQDHAGAQVVTLTVRNTIFQILGGALTHQGIFIQTNGTALVQNCTVATTDGGLAGDACLVANLAGLTITSQNNYLKGRTCYKQTAGTISKGANDATVNAEATTVGLRNVPFSTANFKGVTLGSENLHLVSGSVLRKAGADLSGSFTDDIDGDVRVVPFDIGADQFIAVGGPLVGMAL